MPVTAILCGFQTGADIAGARAAVALGLGVGGFMPKGWLTESGAHPEYEELYGAMESASHDYKVRTKMNVHHADATVIFGKRSPGSNATEEFCRVLGRPYKWVSWPSANDISDMVINVQYWLNLVEVNVLNISGNRESVNPGIEKFVEEFLRRALK